MLASPVISQKLSSSSKPNEPKSTPEQPATLSQLVGNLSVEAIEIKLEASETDQNKESHSKELPPLVKPSDSDGSHWNASMLTYYTGIAISPTKSKHIQKPQSPSRLFKFLKKSPSMDSDSGTGASCQGKSLTNEVDRLSPLKQRSLSCTSSTSSTTSSASSNIEQIQKKQKPKTSGFSSLRFLKVMRRPSLLTMGKTQSLERNPNKLPTDLGGALNNSSDNIPAFARTSATTGSSKGFKSLRNSLRAVKNFLPSKSKGDTSSCRKKVSSPAIANTDKKLDSDYNESSSTISYSAPNTPKTQKRSDSKEIKGKKLKGTYKSASTSNLSNWRGEEGSVKASNLDAVNVEEREKVLTKKSSFLKNLTKRMKRKSQERDLSSTVDSENTKDSTSLGSHSKSQEILRLDNEPRVRTPKTLRKKSDSQERDREVGEMEVTEKALEKVEGEHSSASKSSEKIKNPKTSSSEKIKSTSSKGKESPITFSTQINDGESVDPELEETGKGSNDGEKKKKSWSEVVFVGSSTTSSVNNGKLLETKLDQDDEERKVDERQVKVSDIDQIPADQSSDQQKVEDPSKDDDNDVTPSEIPIEKENNVSSQSSSVVNEKESQHVEKDIEIGKEVGDEESSCTESFKQLNPFDFNGAHVEKGKRERLYKVLVVGELGSGKTSIIKRYVHQFFSQHYRATIGVDFALKVLRWDGDTVVRLQLWDIAGQERFGSMTRVYYKEAVGAFVVFDVTRSATLEAVPKWKADLDSKVALPDGRPIPTILLANKSDQPKEGIAANRDKMNEFCQQQGFSAWFETSAKENINIDEASNFLVSKILEMDRWSQEPLATDPDKVDISANGKHKLNTSNNCAC